MSGIDFSQRWAVNPDDEPFCPWPDPDAGPRPRPCDQPFIENRRPRGRPIDPREIRVLNTIRGYRHTTIEIARKVPAPVQAQVQAHPKAEDTPERRAQRWRQFVDGERRANAARRASRF